MVGDVVIRAEGLGKKYLIGHAAERERYVALRDVMARGARSLWRKTADMARRRAIAVAAHLEPEILVVDEVLAVGDAEFQKKCLGKMSEVAGGGRTVLFVSHNLPAAEALCSRCLHLASGALVGDAEPGKIISA